MTIALVAKDKGLIASVGQLLTGEGAEPLSVVSVHEILNEDQTVRQADLIFLVSKSQDFLSAGEAVSQIRRKLGKGQELVLCITPPPYKAQRLQLLSLGAHEIISPAGSTDEQIAERILGHLILKKRILPYKCGQLLGATSPMREIYKRVERYAPLTRSVLIRGETGTGKGLVAQELHEESGRLGEFIHFNSTALNSGTIEAELFGHVKGGHNTAFSDRKGLIEAAQKGTVFIDEIGDFNLELQAKLLDVVEYKRVRPVGATQYKNLDVRFIFATNCDLERLVNEGRFREDLFARMDRLSLTMPPLRKRKADIPLLVEHFINNLNEETEDLNEETERPVTVETGAVDELFRKDWRLNVRELSSVVEKAEADVGDDRVITNFVLSSDDAREIPPGGVIEINPRTQSWFSLHDEFHEAYFRSLAAISNSIEEAMNHSKVSRSHLFEIFKKYDLHIGGKPS
ncbi:MAG TPA: sigma 54-interacting transcriptional regulator [Pyrinomonadaceae bacterium]|nr:sigma 54-interacting transcriptional regulator [Pyrinomonadaceae bacterium]